MGAGICLVYLMNGFNVILKEINDKALAAGVARIADAVNRFLKGSVPSFWLSAIAFALILLSTCLHNYLEHAALLCALILINPHQLIFV